MWREAPAGHVQRPGSAELAGRRLAVAGIGIAALATALVASHPASAERAPRTSPVYPTTPSPTPVPAPAGAPTPAPAPTPSPAADDTPPVVTARVLTRKRKSLTQLGLKVSVTINEPGSVTIVVTNAQGRQLSKPTSGLASMPLGGTQTLGVQLTPATKARLRRSGKLRWKVTVLATDGRGNHRTITVPFRLG